MFAILFLSFLTACNEPVSTKATDGRIAHYGRTTVDEKGWLELIGSASYIEFSFSGSSCNILMKHLSSDNGYGFIAVEIDNQYVERVKVLGDTIRTYTMKASGNKKHLLRIFKASEAQNGQIAIIQVNADNLKSADHPAKKKIEFIGNSITCGMGVDATTNPCNSGQWYDQHNAYWAYGPRVARDLNVDFTVSAVSGIGIYRTWNKESPSMPSVYESLYLNPDDKKKWDFNGKAPDVVSIALGTNDLSDGDMENSRKPFDSVIFINNYVKFVGTIYNHYPNTQIAFLTSPMLDGEKAALLLRCLNTIKKQCTQSYSGKKPAAIFQFKPMKPRGCDYHPGMEDHKILADEVKEFYRSLLFSK